MEMRALFTHVAGVDVHKDVLAITVLIGEADEKPKMHQFECLTFTEDLKTAGRKLLEMGVRHVVMESTGVYWKCVYNVWHPMGLKLTVANAYHVKKVPGRKTDMLDSQWLAWLHRHGLLRSSFIPTEEFQRLRLLTRHRKSLTQDIARIKNRAQKVLEDGNIKLGSVVSDVFGQAGFSVLKAIAEGQTDPFELLNKIDKAALSRLKRKEDLPKALSNCLSPEHCFLIKQLVTQYLYMSQSLEEMEQEIRDHLTKHADIIERLVEVPGIDEDLAQAIFAETGGDLDSFKDDRHFAAWAGTAPGNHESAGKKKEQRLGMETQI